MRDRNHELIILLFLSNAKRFWKHHLTSLLHIQKHSTTVLHGLQWDWVNPNPPQHVPIMQRTTEKHFVDDLITYPKALSNCIAWTSAWVNQKGCVTCSYNVTHDGKISITILLHISNYSWTSAWVNLKGYVTCSYNVRHARRKNNFDDFVTYLEALISNCVALTSAWVNLKISSNPRQRQFYVDVCVGKPESIYNMYLYGFSMYPK